MTDGITEAMREAPTAPARFQSIASAQHARGVARAEVARCDAVLAVLPSPTSLDVDVIAELRAFPIFHRAVSAAREDALARQAQAEAFLLQEMR